MTKHQLLPLNDPSHVWNKSFSSEIQWAIETLQQAAKTDPQRDMVEILSRRGLNLSLQEDASRARLKHMQALHSEHMTKHHQRLRKLEEERQAQIAERMSRNV